MFFCLFGIGDIAWMAMFFWQFLAFERPLSWRKGSFRFETYIRTDLYTVA
jgi:hypothetical protein